QPNLRERAFEIEDDLLFWQIKTDKGRRNLFNYNFSDGIGFVDDVDFLDSSVRSYKVVVAGIEITCHRFICIILIFFSQIGGRQPKTQISGFDELFKGKRRAMLWKFCL